MAAALTIARAYQHSFESHPNTTLAITGGCLNALADVVAQVSQNTVCPNPYIFWCVFLLTYPCRYISGGKSMKNTVVTILRAVYDSFVMVSR